MIQQISKFIIVFTVFSIPGKVWCQKQLLDRILVQINDEIYTQWQMEVHFIIKRSLFLYKKNPITDQSNWTEINCKNFAHGITEDYQSNQS